MVVFKNQRVERKAAKKKVELVVFFSFVKYELRLCRKNTPYVVTGTIMAAQGQWSSHFYDFFKFIPKLFTFYIFSKSF